ncbi:YncE family protein [Anatilimnocola sp. NA78]|uniref:YncE family protein n=1 Tax=Anatilimnocola sp. NA78 TaxID=3415683 RepID=UPI003CE4CA0C
MRPLALLVRLSLCGVVLAAAFVGNCFGQEATKAKPAKPKLSPEEATAAREKARYPLSYPPKLAEGKLVVSEQSDSFLVPGENLREGVAIAKSPPRVDFAFFPEQNYPGNPWSNRADGFVLGDKYYTSDNDHLAPKGTAHLWEYDAGKQQFRLLCDTTNFLESKNVFPPEMNYRPGEMQSRIDLGSDGWLYYATDRGSPTVTHDKNGYLGEWILRTNPMTLETQIVKQFPIPKHTLPASVLDPKRMIYYGGTAPGKDAANQSVQFFALDVKSGKLLKVADNGPTRVLIFSPSTGYVFWEGCKYDPATNEITPAKIPHVRSASPETPQGLVYCTSGTKADLWSLNVKTGEVKDWGTAAVGSQEYISSIEVDPTGRYLYYVPGAHGGAIKDGTPIVQFDLQTKQRKVLAFLHVTFWEKHGYALDGSFSSALDEQGARLFISWDGWRKGQPRGWETAAITVVHIPASERIVGGN